MQTNRNDFLELLQRYIDGRCSSSEQQMMDYWYDLLGREPEGATDTLSDEQREALLWAKIQQRLRAKRMAQQEARLHPWQQPDEP